MKFQPRLIVLLTALSLLYGWKMRPPLSAGDPPHEDLACASNLKQIQLAFTMYGVDNDERMPLASTWMDATYPYTRNWEVYRCPSIAAQNLSRLYGYAMNVEISGKLVQEGSPLEPSPLVFDSANLRKNAFGTLKLLPKNGRHDGKNNVQSVRDGLHSVEAR